MRKIVIIIMLLIFGCNIIVLQQFPASIVFAQDADAGGGDGDGDGDGDGGTDAGGGDGDGGDGDGGDGEKSYKDDNGQTAGGEKCVPGEDIMLNISIPFVGRCIKKEVAGGTVKDVEGTSTVGNAFPKLMGGMMRLVMTIIYIIGFLGILVGGFMIAASGVDSNLRSKGKNIIMMVIGGLILLGATGVILNLINPNFFGVAS